jgi:hypothetical protein
MDAIADALIISGLFTFIGLLYIGSALLFISSKIGKDVKEYKDYK